MNLTRPTDRLSPTPWGEMGDTKGGTWSLHKGGILVWERALVVLCYSRALLVLRSKGCVRWCEAEENEREAELRVRGRSEGNARGEIRAIEG